MTKYAVHNGPHALYITHVRRERDYIRARHSRNDNILRLVQDVAGTCHDRNGSTRTRVLQRRFAPDAARSPRDENDFSAVGLRGV